jgi:RecA-family ATPase
LPGCSPKDVQLAEIPAWLFSLVDSKPVTTNNAPGWIAELLRDLSSLGRHQSFAKIIGRFNTAGLSADDIYSILLPHWEASGLKGDELRSMTQNMTKRYAAQAAKPLKGMSSKELLASAKAEIPWLVDGLFPREGVGIIAGQPKIGKSWLTLDLAITVSQGGLWLGKFPVEAGHVLYVDEESTRDMLGFRYRKMLNAKGLDDANIQFLSKEGFNFSTQNKIDELRGILDLLHPKLVIFDSLNRVHNAEENSASEMGAIFRKVTALSKEYGCFILFTDHLPHGAERFRGTSDKAAFVDAGFLATKIGNSNVQLEHKYARLTEPVKSFELAILDDGPEKTYIRWIG